MIPNIRSDVLRYMTFASIILLSACSFPGVFKVDVAQGNILTQSMLQQLKPGMTKQQVRYVLGTPLIQDSLHKNRWDYTYRLLEKGSVAKHYKASIFFNNGQYTHYTASNVPTDESF